MTGGVAAFWGAAIIGPRTGRFVDGRPVPIRGHSSVLQALGTFILWMGWYGFNPGSTLAITPTGYAAIAARATVCTTISAAFGGMTVVLITKRLDHVWDLGALCNGILAGLVSITAPCAARPIPSSLCLHTSYLSLVCSVSTAALARPSRTRAHAPDRSCATVYPWHAMVIGIIGGFVYLGGSRLELKLKIDDPLDAFAVHGTTRPPSLSPPSPGTPAPRSGLEPLPHHTCCAGCCGFWACVATGLFSVPAYSWGAGGGAFFGEGKQLGITLITLLAEIAWTSTLAGTMFFALKMANLLRITPDVEDLGMDLSKHGGSAYTFHQQEGVSSQDPLDVSKVRPRCAANPDAVCPVHLSSRGDALTSSQPFDIPSRTEASSPQQRRSTPLVHSLALPGGGSTTRPTASRSRRRQATGTSLTTAPPCLLWTRRRARGLIPVQGRHVLPPLWHHNDRALGEECSQQNPH